MSNSPPAVGLSLMPSDDFRIAATPLFAAGEVDVIEWSFDLGWGRSLSAWMRDTLRDYSDPRMLLGHGVSYSALDASETNRQDEWLCRLRAEMAEYHYSHISEHFGFMGGGNFHIAAPLPVPRTRAALDVGRKRLQQLADVAGVPVGLENLAFAFNIDDVQQQGPFLEDLLAPVDGFLLLDLHNLYCQACNFDVELLALLDSYPLHRVRELHVSGGSWSEHPAGSGNRVRRDTHDDDVPEEIYAAIPEVLRRCSGVEAVILERMGDTIDVTDEASVNRFRSEFQRLRKVVRGVPA